MRKILIGLLLLAGSLWSQPSTNYTQLAWDSGAATPSYCTKPAFFWRTDTLNLYVCNDSHQFTISSSGGGGGSITINTTAPLGGGTTGSTFTLTCTNCFRIDTSNTVTTGTQDFTSATATSPLKTGLVANIPGTCAVGNLYFATNATAGQQIYECDSLNHWTQQLNSGGAGSGTFQSIVTDLKPAYATSSTLTVQGGAYGYFGTSGVTPRVPASAATLKITAGSGTETGVLCVGDGVLEALTATNTLSFSSGGGSCGSFGTCTTAAGSACPTGQVQIATFTQTSGAFDALGVTDFRTPLMFMSLSAGTEISVSGNQISRSLSTSTPSVGTCGTIGAGSTNYSGFINTAVTGSCVSVVTFTTTATTGWSCGVSNSTTANLHRQSASSTTTATFTGTTVSGDVLRYTCNPY